MPTAVGRRIVAMLTLFAGLGCSETSAPSGEPAATGLTFLQQPTKTTAGAPIGSPVRVAVVDSAGRIHMDKVVTVTISLEQGPPGTTLRGTAARETASGIATFDDLTIELAGSGFVLTATAPGLATASSNAFAIGPAAAHHFAFGAQPADAMVGAELPPVTVSLRDAYGNAVTSALATITMTLNGGTVGAVLGGTQTRGTIAGVATFDDLTVDRTGAGFTLTAAAAGLTSATSAAFTVSSASMVLSRTGGDGQDGFPGHLVRDSLSVRVTDPQGAPMAGQLVRWSTASGMGIVTPDTVRTNAAGEAVARWAVPESPGHTVTATARVAGFRTDFTANVTLGDWNWRKIALPGAETRIASVVVDPTDFRVWYVWGIQTPLFVTHDSGATWTTVLGGGINANALAVDPADSRRVYAAAGPTLYRSSDRGLTWTALRTFGEWNRSIHVSARDGAIYFAPQWPFASASPTVPPGIYRSRDGGVSFAHLPYGIPLGTAILTWDIAEHPATGTLLLGNEIADHPSPYRPPFLRSGDAGATWQNVAPPGWWHAVEIQIDLEQGAIYALLEGAGLWKSTDDGRSWSEASTHRAISMLIDPAHPNRFFTGNVVFGALTGGAFISVDRGRQFWPLEFDGKTVGGFARDTAGNAVLVAVYSDGLYLGGVPDHVP